MPGPALGTGRSSEQGRCDSGLMELPFQWGQISNSSFFHLFTHLIHISVNPVPDPGNRNELPTIAALRSVAILDQEC